MLKEKLEELYCPALTSYTHDAKSTQKEKKQTIGNTGRAWLYYMFHCIRYGTHITYRNHDGVCKRTIIITQLWVAKDIIRCPLPFILHLLPSCTKRSCVCVSAIYYY